MTQKDKERVIAALEEYKGDSIGVIAATIEDCQRVVAEMAEDNGWIPVKLGFLPDEEDTRNYFLTHQGEYPEYQVVTDGARVPTVLTYCGNNTWVDQQNYHYKVTHWQPLAAMPEV